MRRRPPIRRVTLGALLACLLAAAAAGCGREGDLAAPPPGGTTRTQTDAARTTPGARSPTAAADVRLRNTAVRYARATFKVRTLARDVTLRRSRRDPRWAITSGAYGRTLWVVWLRSGEVARATTRVREFDPPQVPCDVRPAFAKPKC
jgi:predicted small lipoprotein YifL